MLLRNALCTSFLKSNVFGVVFILSACGGSSPDSPTNVSNTLPLANPVPITSAAMDGTERSPVNDDLSQGVPAPSDLTITNLRSGFVSLQWTPSVGDVNQQQPEGDSVSYYRVYRDGEILVDAFSSFVVDASAPIGEVVYSVEAVKFVTEPEYGFTRSALVDLVVQVPSAQQEAANVGGVEISNHVYESALADFQNCVISHAYKNVAPLCVNAHGYAWPLNADGTPGDVLHNTRSIAGDVMVSVRNKEAEFGPVPGNPTWTLKILSTGENIVRDVTLGDGDLSESEGHVVNGTAVADDGTVFISGTLYQSYLPRSLAPSADLLPVINAYYIAQYNYSTGEQLQFKRFSLSEAPGALASASNGELELHQAGKVTWYDAQSLTPIKSVRVTGYPIFSDERSVYTQSFDPDSFFRFAL